MSKENSEESWRGKVGKLSQQDIDRFLEEPNLARVACLDATGWPYAIPCWYQWDGKSIWLVARAKSKWAHFLVAEARCAVTIDESSAADDQQAKGAGVQRNFAAQCNAVIVEEPNVGGKWVEVATRMSVRYLGENGPDYLAPTLPEPRWLIFIRPDSLTTWQGVDWATRYKTTDWG